MTDPNRDLIPTARPYEPCQGSGDALTFRLAFTLPIELINAAERTAENSIDAALTDVVIDYRCSRFMQGRRRFHVLLSNCDLDPKQPILDQQSRLQPDTVPFLLFELLNLWFDAELPSQDLLWRYLDTVGLFHSDDTICHGLLYNFLVVPFVRHGNLGAAEELAKLALKAYEQTDARYLQAFMQLHLAIIRTYQADLLDALACLDKAARLFDEFGGSRWETGTVDTFRLWIGVERTGKFPAIDLIEKTGDDLLGGGFWPEAFLALATVHVRALAQENPNRALARLPGLETTVRARGMTQILPALQILREEILGVRDAEGEIALPDDQLLLLMPNRQTPLSVRTEADTAFPRLSAVAALIDGDHLLRHQQFDSAAPRFLEALDLIARHGLIHVLKQNAKPVRQFLSECRKRRRFVEKARHYRDTLMADLAVPNTRSDQPSELTAAEYGVLRRLPLATSNKGLALELEVTEATVKFHLKKIYKKLGVHSRPEAIRAAAEKGWIDPLS